jgi:hypothetical protein
VHEAGSFIVEVDEASQIQRPDGGLQGWEGSSQTIFPACKTRTMKLCSSDAHSDGQSGCSSSGKVEKSEGPRLGYWHVLLHGGR